MKASIWIATHNNEILLRNCLYSLTLQKITFPWELCIIDDCSDKDPWPVIAEYFPQCKYKRLDIPAGFNFAQSYCFDLCDPDSDVIIMQCADVIYTAPNIIDMLCKKAGPKIVSFPETVDMEIPENFYTNFDGNIQNVLDNWQRAIGKHLISIDGDVYSVNTKYTGNGASWLFFSGAILKSDLINIGYKSGENICDGVMHYMLLTNGFVAEICDELKVIHQKHPKSVYPCSVVEKCIIRCIRKSKRYIDFTQKSKG